MNIEDYAKENHYRTRNLHDGRPVPPASLDLRKRTRKERQQETLRSEEEKCIAIVGEHGYVFKQDGKLEWFIIRQKGGPLLRKTFQPILDYSTRGRSWRRSVACTLDQKGDLEAAGTAPLAAIEHVLEAIKVRRVSRGNPSAKGRSKEYMGRIRKLRGQGPSPSQDP